MSQEHYMTRVLSASPINRQAGLVTTQRGCATEDEPLTKQELVQLVARLERKHRLLKHVLGIKNKSQHMNVMWKFNKGIRQSRYKENPRSMVEYKRCGEEMQRLIKELAALKQARRAAALANPNPEWSEQ